MRLCPPSYCCHARIVPPIIRAASDWVMPSAVRASRTCSGVGVEKGPAGPRLGWLGIDGFRGGNVELTAKPGDREVALCLRERQGILGRIFVRLDGGNADQPPRAGTALKRQVRGLPAVFVSIGQRIAGPVGPLCTWRLRLANQRGELLFGAGGATLDIIVSGVGVRGRFSIGGKQSGDDGGGVVRSDLDGFHGDLLAPVPRGAGRLLFAADAEL